MVEAFLKASWAGCAFPSLLVDSLGGHGWSVGGPSAELHHQHSSDGTHQVHNSSWLGEESGVSPGEKEGKLSSWIQMNI